MKKKIGIDLTYIKDNKFSGIKKHAEEIINGLNKIDLQEYEFIIFCNDIVYNDLKLCFPNNKFEVLKFVFKGNKFLKRINYFHYYKNRKFSKSDCEIIFHPYANIYTGINNSKKNICTIHDLTELYLCGNEKSFKYKIMYKFFGNILKKSVMITTISTFVKNEILKYYPNIIEDDRIVVIPNIVTKPIKYENEKFPEGVNNKSKYIFALNAFNKYKNQITLLKSFNLIKDNIDCNLVLVGREEKGSPLSGYDEVIEYIKSNNLSDRVKIYSEISDNERNTLLYNSKLFVSNSLYEGFGRTPIEAAMCEVPVISTRETSLPEATKELVYYYKHPLNENELSDKILEILDNPPLKEKLKNISQTLEAEYNEGKIISKYIDVLDEVFKPKKVKEK